MNDTQTTDSVAACERSLERRVRPMVPCPRCGGNGRTFLPAQLWATYCAMADLGSATAADVLAKIGQGADIKITAVNNRLESLRDVGLAVRKRERKFWRYWPAWQGKRSNGCKLSDASGPRKRVDYRTEHAGHEAFARAPG